MRTARTSYAIVRRVNCQRLEKARQKKQANANTREMRRLAPGAWNPPMKAHDYFPSGGLRNDEAARRCGFTNRLAWSESSEGTK